MSVGKRVGFNWRSKTAERAWIEPFSTRYPTERAKAATWARESLLCNSASLAAESKSLTDGGEQGGDGGVLGGE